MSAGAAESRPAASGRIALIPARDFGAGKSRLAAILPPDQRRRLGQWMLERVLSALQSSHMVERVLVLSDATDVLALAAARHAEGIRCPGSDLNEDLELGRQHALRLRASAVVVLPADLPLLEPADVVRLIGAAAAMSAPCTSLARSADGGTNGMLQRPADAYPFAFGPNSFERHWSLAREGGAASVRCDSAGLQFDLDTPEELQSLARRRPLLAGWPLGEETP